MPQALWPHWYLIDALVVDRAFAEIPQAVVSARTIAAGEPISEGIFGWALAAAGQTAQALEILETLTERRKTHYCPAVPIAWIYLGLGEDQRAIDWLEVAFDERDPLLTMVFASAAHDRLLGDHRNDALLRRMNFGGVLPTLAF